MYPRIALVKTGWSDDYMGGPVLGRYANLRKYGDDHEKFNFLHHAGQFYGYLPPIGTKQSPPQPKVREGWLLMFISAKNGNGPLTVVGWYENATFHEKYIPRPEYAVSNDFELDAHGNQYVYCVSANAARLIPTTARGDAVSGKHIRRTPVVYVRGNGKDEGWRQALARFAESLASGASTSEQLPPKLAFPDPEHRKRVERAAICAAKKFLGKDHDVKDRQGDKCGYDLLGRHRKTGEEIHVEVKGTTSTPVHFYMSRKEFRYMPSPRWRLIVVSDALRAPKVELFNAAEVGRGFSFDPFAWEATVRPKGERKS